MKKENNMACGAECPTCHGTGRIGTTDWLTRGLSKKQLAEEKAKAIAEHEQRIKTEVANEVIDEFIEKVCDKYEIWTDSDESEYHYTFNLMQETKAELKKKYMEV
jgi:Ribonuclease G/E